MSSRVIVTPAPAIPASSPAFITGDGPMIAGWHHAPAVAERRGAAIVLVPPFGFEYMSAYHCWRLLAERLAAVGFDAFRFDYPGTGDSAGAAGATESWSRSVLRMIDWARHTSASSRIGIVALRGGTIPALQATSACPVDRLVLWSPFASGQACLRELRALRGLSRQDHADEEPDAPDINASGHVLHAHRCDEIGAWSYESVATAPAGEILLVERDDRPPDRRVESHLQRLDARVTTMSGPGTSDMLLAPQLSRVPHATIEEVVNWFEAWRPAPVAGRAGVPALARNATWTPVNRRFVERTIRFGDRDRLFGILTEPSFPDHGGSAVLCCNTGVEHHIGPHGMYVGLARQWAERGHLVLRFDIGGIGDSAAPTPSAAPDAYPLHMLEDARAAVAFLRTHAGAREVIVIGLCSGGWLAFRSARDGLDINAAVAINPPLYLREGQMGHQWVSDAEDLDRYRGSLRDATKWLKALSGGASYTTFARLATSALKRRLSAVLATTFAETLPAGLPRDLETIASRGVRMQFVFSAGDDGLRYFNEHASPALHRRDIASAISHVVVEGAGHSFRPLAAQTRLREILDTFVA
jgi:alpha-beta hydrolase superfamily lysophospholipase